MGLITRNGHDLVSVDDVQLITVWDGAWHGGYSVAISPGKAHLMHLVSTPCVNFVDLWPASGTGCVHKELHCVQRAVQPLDHRVRADCVCKVRRPSFSMRGSRGVRGRTPVSPRRTISPLQRSYFLSVLVLHLPSRAPLPPVIGQPDFLPQENHMKKNVHSRDN